jgi:hypothetical protein
MSEAHASSPSFSRPTQAEKWKELAKRFGKHLRRRGFTRKEIMGAVGPWAKVASANEEDLEEVMVAVSGLSPRQTETTTRPSEGVRTGPPGQNSFLTPKGSIGKETNFCPVSAATLLAEEPKPIAWVWEPFLPEGGLVLLVSFMKVGKSTLAYPLAIAIAQGKPFLGYPTKQGGVLILAVEEHPRDVERRLRRFGLVAGDLLYVHPGRLDNSEATFKALRNFIIANKIKAVILDTLPRFWSVYDENDNAQVMRAVSPFLELAQETGAVVILLHHERKSGGEDGRGIRGGSALLAIVDQALMLERRQGGTPTQRVLRALGRYDETPGEVILDLAGDEYRRLGTSEELKSGAKEGKVWAALSSEEARDVATIAKGAGLTEKETRKILEGLETRVIREGGGVKGSPYTYRRAIPDSILPQPIPIGKETNSYAESMPESVAELVGAAL